MSKREKILLAVTAFLLLLALRIFLWPGGGNAPPTAATPPRAAAVLKGGAKGAPLAFIPVKLDLLSLPRASYKPPLKRNPFQFGQAVVVDSPRRAELEQMRRSAEDEHKRLLEQEQQRIEAQRPQLAAKPAPPSFDLLFVGYVGPPRSEIAIFRDGKDYLLAKVGETLKDQYELVSIGYESVEIKFRQSGETHRFPLATGLQTLRK